MQELDLPGQIFLCLLLGATLSMVLLAAVAIGKAWRHAWGWIDDQPPSRNPVIELLARLRGWSQYTTEGRGYLWWKDKKGEERLDPLFAPLMTLIALPLAVFLSFKLYPLLLTGLTLLMLAYVARFARRHKKLFDKHLKDPEAHK